MFILFNLLLHKVRSTYLFPHMFFPFSDMFFFISCSAAQLFFKALSQKMKNLFFFSGKEKKNVLKEKPIGNGVAMLPEPGILLY